MENESELQRKIADFRKSVKDLLSHLPDEFAAAHSDAKQIRSVFHEEIALALEPRLNAYAKNEPHETYADKKTLAQFINHELHEVGLCLCCPRTQQRAILIADVRDANSKSRFRFDIGTEKGKTSRTVTSYDLPDLQLLQELPRREGGSKWKPSQGR